jgi:outer membrane protein assembly factor BamB
VAAINPETGEIRWEAFAGGGANSVGYYRGTPYLEVNGAVINPVNGALLNMGRSFKTVDGKSIEVIQSYIFPQQNVILVYGKVAQGVVENNIDEVFCVIEYRSGNTLWTRKDMFKTTAQKPEKKGLGGFIKQAGTELTKGELQRFDDAKNPGERFLTNPLVTNDGNILLPLNSGLFAIESKTGNVLWKKEYAVKKKGLVTTKTSDPTTVIAFNNDSTQLYISRADFTESIDVKTGAPLWKDPMPSAGPASFLHLSGNGLLSLPTKEAMLLQNKRISLFDANTG